MNAPNDSTLQVTLNYNDGCSGDFDKDDEVGGGAGADDDGDDDDDDDEVGGDDDDDGNGNDVDTNSATAGTTTAHSATFSSTLKEPIPTCLCETRKYQDLLV